MATALGIDNPNSKFNRSLREAALEAARESTLPKTPAVVEPGLFVICTAYRDAENWTAWFAKKGDHTKAEVFRRTAANFRVQLRKLLAELVA